MLDYYGQRSKLWQRIFLLINLFLLAAAGTSSARAVDNRAKISLPVQQIPNTPDTSTAGGAEVEWRHLVDGSETLPTPPGSTDQTASLVLDVDRDGVNDFIIGARREPGPAVVWYRRTARDWQIYIIENEVLPIEAGGAVHDVDGDGDLDIVFGSDSNDNKIWWWENPYPTYRSDTPWTRHTIRANGPNQYHDMIFSDVDGDEEAEFIFWNQRGQQLLVAEIPADPRSNTPWPATPIFECADSFCEGLAIDDIDLDGNLDIVGGGRWFKREPNGSYQPFLLDEDLSWSRVAVGQLIPGGRPEIVMSQAEIVGPMRWYFWNGSQWVSKDLLGYDPTTTHSLQIIDLNQDGYLDIFAAEMRLGGENEDAKMSAFYGDGAGNFTVHNIATGIGNHESRVADLDGDGDLDILGKPFDWDTPRLDVWINTATSLPVDQWQRHVVDDERPWRAIFIEPGDINGDQLPDIITGGWWYANPGAPDGVWDRRIIGEPLNNMATVHDFDGDGALDILGTAGVGSAANDDMVWAHNDGTGNFTVHQNVDQADGAFLQGTTVNRFLTGGPLQVILAWQQGLTGTQALTVPENPETEPWEWSIISDVSQGEGLDSADIDRDGDNDILLGTKWLRNEGTDWTPITLHNPETGQPDRSYLVDMDRDGDLDAVIGYGHDEEGKLAWYEQPDDAATLWTEHLIANLINPQSVDVADMDRDGDLDIVVGEHNLNALEESRLFLYENIDGQGGAWEAHLLYTGDEHHDAARLVDIDGDGDLDIVSTGWIQNRVLLYENLAPLAAELINMPQARAGWNQTLADENGDGRESVTLNGSASTDNGSIETYIWRVEGREVAREMMAETVLSVGEHVITLTIVDDEGNEGTDTISVLITPPGPAISAQPTEQIVAAGQRAHFQVMATGAESLTYQWQRNGVDIPGATASRYAPLVAPADDGQALRVIITNAYGSVTSQEVTLRVSTLADDFNRCALDQTRWTFHDPQAGTEGASTLTVDGERLFLSVPGNVNHDVWTDGIQAPYLTMPMADEDFALEMKFDSGVSQVYQLQGLLVLEDDENFVRINVQKNPDGLRLLGVSFTNGNPDIEFNNTVPGIAKSFYLRLKRTGDVWQAYYSIDGEQWVGDDAYRFTHTLQVRSVGPFAGNVALADKTPPPLTMVLDYVMDSSLPLTHEDIWVLTPSALSAAASPPVASDLLIVPVGDEQCSEILRLTVQPASGWNLERWTGTPDAAQQNPIEARFTRFNEIVAHLIRSEQYQLVTAVIADGGGPGGLIERTPDKSAYTSGESVTLSAQPAPGWRFIGWRGSITGSNNPITLIMDGNKTIEAVFEESPDGEIEQLYLPLVER
ncbi:MAG: VCBS repeat-containing protein [Caldilineaceae bacterium]|nr:VCBS repeat-containing protein [Caldilineaceae bacterium]